MKNVSVKILKVPSDDDWLDMKNHSLSTKRKSSLKHLSDDLKMKYLASNHSPVYTLQYSWEWQDIPYWVSNHFVRHHVGITYFVSSQRNDIQGDYDRRKAPQDAPVNIRCVANPVAIKNISQSRYCLTASNETRYAWDMFIKELEKFDDLLPQLCVKPCVHMGGPCPEVFSTCRYNESKKFRKEVEDYRKVFIKLKNGK